LGESQAVVFSVVDDILGIATNSHSLEKIYSIEKQKKLKAKRQEKDFSKLHETNLMDQNTMRRIQMN